MNELIKKYEGYRIIAYKCPAGVWTIGYGTTVYPNGKKVKEGDEITDGVAEVYINYYLSKLKLPEYLSKGQREALESLIYNVGEGAYNRSSLKGFIENKDIKGIFKNWDWISANKKPLRGLAKRRAEELYLFMSDEI